MSKLTTLAEYVHTWAPIATQLLTSDNPTVKMYGVKIQQEVDSKRKLLEAELKEAKAFLGLDLATQEAKQPPIKQEEHHKDVEHSTLCGCTKTTSKTECTLTIE